MLTAPSRHQDALQSSAAFEVGCDLLQGAEHHRTVHAKSRQTPAKYALGSNSSQFYATQNFGFERGASRARTLARASAAGRFDVVAQLARELEARRCARVGNVVLLEPSRRKGGGC